MPLYNHMGVLTCPILLSYEIHTQVKAKGQVFIRHPQSSSWGSGPWLRVWQGVNYCGAHVIKNFGLSDVVTEPHTTPDRHCPLAATFWGLLHTSYTVCYLALHHTLYASRAPASQMKLCKCSVFFLLQSEQFTLHRESCACYQNHPQGAWEKRSQNCVFWGFSQRGLFLGKNSWTAIASLKVLASV